MPELVTLIRQVSLAFGLFGIAVFLAYLIFALVKRNERGLTSVDLIMPAVGMLFCGIFVAIGLAG